MNLKIKKIEDLQVGDQIQVNCQYTKLPYFDTIVDIKFDGEIDYEIYLENSEDTPRKFSGSFKFLTVPLKKTYRR